MAESLLQIANLKTVFHTEDGVLPAVDDVSFEIFPGETLGLVGESGCGKSVTSLSIMRLISDPPGKIVNGRIIFEGRNLLALSEKQIRQVRGKDIAMIFQEPMTSLNPVFRAGMQIAEAIRFHYGSNKTEAWQKALDLLQSVGITDPERRINEYPHQLSGGMRQRVMIAMGMSCSPKLLIADEPTTALDVTIQAQILELMKKLKKERSMAFLLITHDMGVIADMCDRVVVMYAGKVMETSQVVPLFRNPLHPYTMGLLNSIPRLDKAKKRLYVVPGLVPDLLNMPPGCRFHPRCNVAQKKCLEQEPELQEVISGHLVRCWYPYRESQGGN